MGSLSIWHLLIVLAVVVVIFGTRKLRNAGGDLGAAVKNFKSAMHDGEAEASQPKPSDVIEGQARAVPPQGASSQQHDKV